MELGSGAMAGLAREGRSYRHLSAVPIRNPYQEKSSEKDENLPKTKQRSRIRSRENPRNGTGDPSIVSPTFTFFDKEKSPPPVAPRPRLRTSKQSPFPFESRTSSVNDPVSPKVSGLALWK